MFVLEEFSDLLQAGYYLTQQDENINKILISLNAKY